MADLEGEEPFVSKVYIYNVKPSPKSVDVEISYGRAYSVYSLGGFHHISVTSSMGYHYTHVLSLV